MTEPKTTLEKIEAGPGKSIWARFLKVQIDMTKDYSQPFHIAWFHPGNDIDARISEENTTLVTVGCAAIDPVAVTRIKTLAAAFWTEEALAPINAAKAARVKAEALENLPAQLHGLSRALALGDERKIGLAREGLASSLVLAGVVSAEATVADGFDPLAAFDSWQSSQA